MFGIGTPELLVILVLALVVVGPQRLPEMGRTIGRALRELRKVQDEVRGMVKTGIGDDLDDVRREIRGTTGELRRVSKDIQGDVKKATDVTPLLPKRRPPHRGRRPAGGAPEEPSTEPEPSTSESEPSAAETPAPEPPPASAAGDASPPEPRG